MSLRRTFGMHLSMRYPDLCNYETKLISIICQCFKERSAPNGTGIGSLGAWRGVSQHRFLTSRNVASGVFERQVPRSLDRKASYGLQKSHAHCGFATRLMMF